MNWDLTYILSQIFTVMMYALLATTYFLKDRKKILIISFIALVANGLEYLFLFAWSGLAMCIFALARNIIFLLDEKKNEKEEKINKKDITILLVLYFIVAILAVFTYDGFLSLLSVFGTMVYTYSVWQKKTIIYKFCGIPVGILWLSYNVYVMSLFGIILEGVLLIASTCGFLLEFKRSKKTDKKR